MKFELACSLAARLRGLAGRDAFDGVLLLAPCNDVHTFVAVIERHSSREWWPTAGDLLELSYSRDGRLFTWGGDDHENMSGMQ